MELLIDNRTKREVIAGEITAPQAVLVAMKTVEDYSHNVQSLTGEEKKERVKRMIPRVLETASKLNLATREQIAQAETVLTAGVDVADAMIEAFIAIAHNPRVIQMADSCQKRCAAGCCKKKL